MSSDARDLRAPFPTTRWSLVVQGSRADSASRRASTEALAKKYWRPIASYVRARLGCEVDEACDRAQDFFLWMLESGFLDRVDPERGSFRGFVKRSLVNFLHDQERKRRTLKRGGGKELVPLHDEEGPRDLPDPTGREPEELLDDMWRRSLLADAKTALEEELESRGKGTVFQVFRDYFLSDEELDYEAVAERHGISRVDVSNYLSLAKKRYRAHLRAAVLETVGDDDQLRAEMHWLFEGHAS